MAGEREAIFFCFFGPGGSGKSTICEKLIAQDPGLRLSVSSTTRKPRPGEVDGEDYCFISVEQFKERIAHGGLVEYTVFNGNYYGTEKRVLEAAIAQEYDVLLDIEVEGVGNLKKAFGNRVVTIFVFPPSISVLKERLAARANENSSIVQERLTIAKQEIAVATSQGFSDYLLLNDDLEEAVKNAQSIINSERMRMTRLSQSYISSVLEEK